jgi:hypothetical protein
VTVESGTNIIAGTGAERIKDAIRRQTGMRRSGGAPPKWDGQAAVRILDELIRVQCDGASGRRPVLQGACV